MLRNSIMTFVILTVFPLALCTVQAKARGVRVGDQKTQKLSVGRATNQPQAQSLVFDDMVDNCTKLNCGAVFISGESHRNATGDLIPFTANIYADENECIRLEVTNQTSKIQPKPESMKIILLSPSGSIWKNTFEDSRPVIMARTDFKGQYTVQINPSSGHQPTNSVQKFGLAYGRYVVGTPVNCPNAAEATLAAEHFETR
jgi:hypothetical protein